MALTFSVGENFFECERCVLCVTMTIEVVEYKGYTRTQHERPTTVSICCSKFKANRKSMTSVVRSLDKPKWLPNN